MRNIHIRSDIGTLGPGEDEDDDTWKGPGEEDDDEDNWRGPGE